MGSAPSAIQAEAFASGVPVPQAADGGPVFAYACLDLGSGGAYIAWVDSSAHVIDYAQSQGNPGVGAPGGNACTSNPAAGSGLPPC